MRDVELYCGDALTVLKGLPDGCAQTCVTSPPYWGGLRDYGTPGQLGLERNPDAYTDTLAAAFAETARVLKPDGCLWLNLGDAYAASGKGGGGNRGSRRAWETVKDRKGFRMPPAGFKMKDLTLTPFRVAERLRADGWYLRATIIWSKPSAVEPMRLDRPAVSHEYLFLFSRSRVYRCEDPGEPWWGQTVWVVGSETRVDHPAAMPAELARRCIVASSQLGDVVLDPFAGSGTTLAVALELGRRAVGVELNPAYHPVIRSRIRAAQGRRDHFEGVGTLFDPGVTPDLFAGAD